MHQQLLQSDKIIIVVVPKGVCDVIRNKPNITVVRYRRCVCLCVSGAGIGNHTIASVQNKKYRSVLNDMSNTPRPRATQFESSQCVLQYYMASNHS